MKSKSNFLIEFGRKIREKRMELDISQDDLAKRIGYTSRSTISKIESGSADVARDKVVEIADALGVSPAYLMGWEDPNDTKEFVPARKRGVKVPILGTVVAGVPVAAVQDIIGYEEITEDLARRGEFYGLKIKGDSMAPRLEDGDIIIFRAQNDCETGQIAIVSIDGDDATCKKVMKSEHGITLIAYNQSVYEPTFYSNEEIEKLPVSIVGVVVESRRSFL